MIFEFFSMLLSAFLLAYLSPKVVNYASAIAKASKISPLIIGMLVIGIGTSIPEISNSLISSVLGHGDINVGDTIGSSISQITLVLGICVLIDGFTNIKRDDILVLGLSTVLASVLCAVVVAKNAITRLDGFLLVISYFAIITVLRNYIKKGYFPLETEERVFEAKKKLYAFKLIITTLGVVFGSYVLVSSVISLSRTLNIPEFIISFVAVGISTSLPEIVIGVSAVRQKEYELVFGDIFGSNIVDTTLSLGFGPIIAPNYLYDNAIRATSCYLILVTFIVTLIFATRQRVSKKWGFLLLGLYLASMPLLIQ